MEYLKQFMFGLLITLVAREIIGYLSLCSHWLVRAAARRLPAEERERFIDENLADLDAIEGPFSKLYNALGCFSAVASLINDHAVASDNLNTAPSTRRFGTPLFALALPLLTISIWNIYTTFRGLADLFDLPTHPSVNPGQFAFEIIVTIILFGFVVTSRLIWSFASEEAPLLLLKAASLICIMIDVGASWIGTKRVIVLENQGTIGLALITAITVLSMIGLSMLLFDRDDGDKPLLS